MKTIATKVAAIKKKAISRETFAPTFSLKKEPDNAEEKIAGKVEKLVANPNIKLFAPKSLKILGINPEAPVYKAICRNTEKY